MTMTHTTDTALRTEELEREVFLIAAMGLAEGRDHYQDTDERFVEFIARLALRDDGWLVRFIEWLRSHDELASAAVVAATEMVRARLAAGLTTSGGNRKVISDALKRADEPGALLEYWFRRYGRTVPKPIRHGVADAVQDLYDEQALAIYDTATAKMAFAQVINFVHPKATTGDQRDLFAYAIARRGPNASAPASLRMLGARQALYALTPEQRRESLDGEALADLFAEAGMTWDLLDGWLLGRTDPRAWEAVLPSMGYADRLSRLRELGECGLPPDVLRRLIDELADPARIAQERILPLRLYTAGREVPSLIWATTIERALQAALANVPSLSGRTLILIDRSASMFTQVTRGSAVTVADQAMVFGTALALRAHKADLIQFGTSHHRIDFTGDELLTAVLERFGHLGDGNAAEVVRARFDGHDRVVIVTDEPHGSAWQGSHPAAALPPSTPAYIWNVAATVDETTAGLRSDQRRHVFSGLTDGAFAVIPLIETADHFGWPF
jgi:hypothetical protein